jgi:thiosulfate dehydrogenase
MKRLNFLMLLSPALFLTGLLAATTVSAQPRVPVTLPAYGEGQYVHVVPSLDELAASSSLHPQLRERILRGRELFNDTQQLRGVNVYTDMNCSSCHLGSGGLNWSGPVWPAATTLPDFRGKNQRVNTLEDRIADCFVYSMNGQPPASGSEDMLALLAWHQWLAKGAAMYDSNIAGRGYAHLGNAMPELTSRERGAALYGEQCALCHGGDGNGRQQDGKVVFPAVWGDNSWNWGAGMSRVPALASFIHNNMPLGKPGSLAAQDAWDLALFINSQERPQDPRYTGDAVATRALYNDFHALTQYGLEVDGRILGQHDNTGAKPFLRPDNLTLRQPAVAEQGK